MKRPDLLRPRRIYLRPSGRYVGFGRAVPQQPDLVEAEYRIGWRILVVCKVCLTTEVQRLQAEEARLRALARFAADRVDEGVASLERRIAAVEREQ
jgi:hypothetical protein